MLEKQHSALDPASLIAQLFPMPRKTPPSDPLSRRERQVMDLLWRTGPASASDILASMPDPPSYSAVRALLAVLVEKGHLTTRPEGRRYIYEPTTPRAAARSGAVRRLLDTFFDSSAANLVATLLDPKERKLEPEELSRIRAALDAHTTTGSRR